MCVATFRVPQTIDSAYILATDVLSIMIIQFFYFARGRRWGGMIYSYLSNVRGGIDSDFPLLQRLPHMEHSILQTNHDRKY